MKYLIVIFPNGMAIPFGESEALIKFFAAQVFKVLYWQFIDTRTSGRSAPLVLVPVPFNVSHNPSC